MITWYNLLALILALPGAVVATRILVDEYRKRKHS